MKKDKTTAAVLALVLGVFGIHRFYLKQVGLGILYIILSFTFGISFILGIIDAIVLFSMREEDFDAKYNRYPYEDLRERQFTTTQSRRNYPPIVITPSKQPPYVKSKQKVADAEVWKQSGIKKFKEYDLGGAIVDFEKALVNNPYDIATHFNIACAYSLSENADKGMFHIGETVRLGFKDYEKIKTHDALAYLRIQKSWNKFVASGYQYAAIQQEMQQEDTSYDAGITEDAPPANAKSDDLLGQLEKLADFKKRGILTEDEYVMQKKKLLG